MLVVPGADPPRMDPAARQGGKIKITVKYPSRGRPQQFFETLDLWIKTALCGYSLQIIGSFDLDDPTMNNADVRRRLAGYQMLTPFFRPHTSKIHALNADLDQATGVIIFPVLDDLIPTISFWDEIMIQDMKENFPDTDGILYYPDQLNDHLCTIPVMGRKYFERFGYLCHPSYKSVYADNEFNDVAKALGKIKFIDRKVFRHDHPCAGNRPRDALNEIDNQNSAADEANYNRRKAEGFPR